MPNYLHIPGSKHSESSARAIELEGLGFGPDLSQVEMEAPVDDDRMVETEAKPEPPVTAKKLVMDRLPQTSGFVWFPDGSLTRLQAEGSELVID